MKFKDFFSKDERIARISEQVQSEGFMVVLILLNIVILIKVGIFGKSFFDYVEIWGVLAVVSLFAGIKSVLNGAIRGTKAMYNIVLSFITPLVMSMAAIKEIEGSVSSNVRIVFLILIPLAIVLITAFVLVFAEKMWEKNNQDSENS